MADTKMEPTPITTGTSDPLCHFLRVPKEVRLEIYRYLLLPNPFIHLLSDNAHLSLTSHRDDSEDDSDASDNELNGSENEWTDESDDMDSIMSEMMHVAEREFFSDDESSSMSSSDSDQGIYERHLAILRCNRQIHFEASSIFYTEAVLTLEPGDIFCLMKRPRCLNFGWPNPCAWKHNPLRGFGKMDQNGIVIYDTPQMTGDVEPHVVSRFQKVSFEGYFGEEHTRSIELWIDDNTHVIRAEDAEEFKSMLRSSTLFKDLAKILRHSPRINLLEITLEIDIMANSDLIMADMMMEDDDLEEEKDFDVEDEVDKIMDIANEKATELFLDSDIMHPLQKLKNVNTCNVKFGFDHYVEQKYEPPEKYVNKLRDMKLRIEANFEAPEESR